ncbi:MAG: AbrB/MazE/SpoVT family DNA-binding domain-containing protein [Desulfurococcales archaeon]|nr:AbrB/MazE/SpoVT family DNA-binding domain-containing protein [Desulfurococcales archaeon]
MEHDSRKLIRVGPGSIALTIPKKWVSLMGLKVGDVVDIYFDGKKLSAVPRRRVSIDESIQIFIDATEGNISAAVHKLTAAFVEGITKVRVHCSQDVLRKLTTELRKVIPDFIVIGSRGRADLYDIVFTSYDVELNDVVNKVVNLVVETVRNLSAGKEVVNYLISEFIRLYNVSLRIAKTKVMEAYGEEIMNVIDAIVLLSHIRELVNELQNYMMLTDDSTLIRELNSTIEELTEAVLNSVITNNIDSAVKHIDACEELKHKLYSMDISERIAVMVERILDKLGNIAEISVRACIRNKACRCRHFYPKV